MKEKSQVADIDRSIYDIRDEETTHTVCRAALLPK